MEIFDRKKHWEKIYNTKQLQEVSWYEPTPATSLSFFSKLKVSRNAKIIDVGGGESLLADHLLNLGYEDITVLDISETALNKAKKRLGEKAARIQWIVADAATFKPVEKYDLWHDRAAFHFLTQEKEIEDYLITIHDSLKPDAILIIGTFSEQGPEKCSGIKIKQYSEKTMTERLQKFFRKIKCITTEHHTPFSTIQQFIFCSFRLLPNPL